LKILVYEHICGGGYAEKPLPIGVLSEGFAMLRCAVADFREAGHEVTVLLDARLAKFEPPTGANYVVQVVHAGEPRKLLVEAAKRNDAIYVVAPETGGTLQTFVRFAEETGKTSLDSKSDAIAEVADKAQLYGTLLKNWFSVPKTLTLNITDSTAGIGQTIERELKYPVVFKPTDGAGCSGISLVKGAADIEDALVKIKVESADTRFIVQEFVAGQPSSVSLFTNGKKAVALSLNIQQITLVQPAEASSYSGGCVPFEHPMKKQAFDLAERVIESFPGLRGYVGVDLILGKEGVFVLDVNARLTTAYIGLRQVVGFNMAKALIETAITGKTPDKPQLLGVACFSKIKTPSPTAAAYRKVARLSGVISPPFPLAGYSEACALIMGYGDSMGDAQLRLEEAKKSLHSIFS